MYYILCVTAGHYLYMNEQRDLATFKNLHEAKYWIYVVTTSESGVCWYDVNEDIGPNPIESEFEIVEIT